MRLIIYRQLVCVNSVVHSTLVKSCINIEDERNITRQRLQIFNENVAKALKEMGHDGTAEYVQMCGKLWGLLKQRKLVKIEEAKDYMEVRSHINYVRS